MEEAAIPPDSSNVIADFSRDLGDAGSLLAEGEWEVFFSHLVQGSAELVVRLIPGMLKAFFVFSLLYAVYRILYGVLSRVLQKSRVLEVGLQHLVLRMVRFTLLTLIVVMVLAQFGINVTGLIAGLSIAGIAVGFAARDTIENFISGLTIFIDRPFRVGDWVHVAGTYGQVEDISFRSTRLRTLDNQLMIMPNIQMVNQKMINDSALGPLRIVVPFGIAYKASIEAARRVVLATTVEDPDVLPDPPPTVVVTELGDSSVNMRLLFFTNEIGKSAGIRARYVERIKVALDKAKIEIPYPHLQVYLDEAKGLHPSTLFHSRPDA